MNHLIFLILIISPVEIFGDCWWTGCQLDNWLVKGCAHYGRYENARSGCHGGNLYHCCAGNGGNNQDQENEIDDNPGQGSSLDISWNQFSKAVTSNPAGESWKWQSPTRDQYNKFINSVQSKGGISTKEEAAMALANFLQESDGLTAKREIICQNTGCPGHYTTPGCDVNGQYYYGRGYTQLTWCYNYRDASRSLFGDLRLVNDPDSVARDENLAWDTAFWFWKNRVSNQPGVKQGRFGVTIKAINGGQECGGPHPEKAERRKRIYVAVREAFKLPGRGDHSGC